MKKRYTFLPKTWLRFNLAAALSCYFSLSLSAQNVPTKLWDMFFGGSDYDRIYSLKQTSDGGYILGGSSDSGNNGDKSQASKGSTDYWVVKLGASGNKIWDKTFGGSVGDELTSLQQTADGSYILGGYSYSGISGDKSQPNHSLMFEDYWVLKLDANGNKLWDKTFGGTGSDALYSIQQTSDGGYILGGKSSSGISGDKSQGSQGAGYYDYWVLKLDASGNKLWDKTFGGSSDDYLVSLQQTSDGGYILGGWSNSGLSGDKTHASKGLRDFWIVKLDAIGNKSWDKTIGSNGGDDFTSLQQTSDGGYILGGYSPPGISGDKTQDNKGNIDYWIVKLDTNGNKIWDKTFGGNDRDVLTSLQQISDGGYIIGGYSESGISVDKTQASHGEHDFWVLKLNGSGNKTWDKTIGTTDLDILTSLQQTSDGGYIMGGWSDSGINGDKTQAAKGETDFWVVKLAATPTGIKEPEASYNLSISPNPNQGKFNLQLSNLSAPIAEVTVSDLLGRVVLQKELQTTNNQLSEELTLPNAKGIYLLQLKAGEQFISRKIVVE